MRLLLVHPFLSFFGGAQIALTWLAQGLIEKGHDIVIGTAGCPDSLKSRLESLGIRVSIRPTGESFAAWIAENSKDRDLIIAGNYPATSWVYEAKGPGLSIPRLWHCCEPPRELYEDTMSAHFTGSAVDPKLYFPWSGFVKRRRTQKAREEDRKAVISFDEIAAISRQTAEWVKNIYGRTGALNPLGVGDMILQSQDFPPGPFIFFSPAGLEPIKNFVTVLKAFRFFLKENPAARAELWMTGDGNWRPHAERLARSLGLSDRVGFLGALPRSEVLNAYAKCHAVVFVPLDEPLGLVVLEAGLAGKPVIAANHGGPSETVAAGETGILVDPLDAPAIAGAMARLFSDRSLCAVLGQKGQQKISREYGFNQYLDRFESICRELVEERVRLSSGNRNFSGLR